MRYASAEALGDDLQHYLDGDSISAHSFNVLDRIAHVLEAQCAHRRFLDVEHDGADDGPRRLSRALRGLGPGGGAAIASPHQRGACSLFAFLGVLFFFNRRSRLLPTSAAERELWTIWIGYFTAYFFIVIVIRALGWMKIIEGNPALPECTRDQIFLRTPAVSVHFADFRFGILHHGGQLLGALLCDRPGILRGRAADGPRPGV